MLSVAPCSTLKTMEHDRQKIDAIFLYRRKKKERKHPKTPGCWPGYNSRLPARSSLMSTRMTSALLFILSAFSIPSARDDFHFWCISPVDRLLYVSKGATHEVAATRVFWTSKQVCSYKQLSKCRNRPRCSEGILQACPVRPPLRKDLSRLKSLSHQHKDFCLPFRKLPHGSPCPLTLPKGLYWNRFITGIAYLSSSVNSPQVVRSARRSVARFSE